jgi:uncharacterized protein (DUF433 family)
MPKRTIESGGANPVIHSDPDILGGTPVFVGTRVPVKALLEYLEAGDPLDEFLDHFPSVSREQAVAVLDLAKEMLTAHDEPLSTAVDAGHVIGEFEGWVDRVDDGVAYLTLRDRQGRTAEARYDAARLAARGISEEAYFRCVLEDRPDGGAVLHFQAMPEPLPDEQEWLRLVAETEARYAEPGADDHTVTGKGKKSSSGSGEADGEGNAPDAPLC